MRSGRGQPDLVRLGLLVPDMNAWTQLQVREGERDLAWVLVPVISAALASSIADAHELGALSTCNSALGAASLASEAFAQAEAVGACGLVSNSVHRPLRPRPGRLLRSRAIA